MRRMQLYWIGQVAGWGGLAAFHIGLLVAVERLVLDNAVGYLVASAMGLAISDGFRRLLFARRWLELTPGRLAARVAATCLVGSLLLVGMSFLVEWWIPGEIPGDEEYPPAVYAAVVLYWAAILAGWSLILLAFVFLRRSRQAEVARWKLEALLHRSELDNLRAQLDPHFLFNSLNGIRGLIAEDPNRAQAAVTQLGAILRASLRANQATTVPLDTEIRTVRNYLELESVRLEHRLRYTIDASPESLAVGVPPMLLQLLVENGIKHGIAARPEGGRITLHAGLAGGALNVRIENTGRLGTNGRPGGVGLANARERLRLVYGERASLSLAQPAPECVRAELRIPVEAS